MALPLPAIYAGGKLLVDNWDTVTIAIDKLVALAKKGDASGHVAQLAQIRADAEKAKAEAESMMENAARLEGELTRCQASLKMQAWITLTSVLAALASAFVMALVLTR